MRSISSAAVAPWSYPTASSSAYRRSSASCSRAPSGWRRCEPPCTSSHVRTQPTTSPRSCCSLPAPDAKPLAGRRLYFVGIGGAGLSAYANIARAWGAEVRGWDARETIFLETLEGVDVDIGGEPAPPPGWEAIVSTAHAGRIDGTPRGDLLAELVSTHPAIVVGGAHGKTTTAAMIAFVLRETGRDPSWIIGGVVPQLGGNAGAGSGWLVVEGDESD